MNYKHNKYNKLKVYKPRLSVQILSVQKRGKKFQYRLSADLKDLIKQVAKEKHSSASNLTVLLWIDYLTKAGYIDGEIKKINEDELKEDVKHFLKYA